MPHRSRSARALCRRPADPRRGDRPRPRQRACAVPRATRRSATISFRSISARRRARDDVPGAAEHTIAVKPIARFRARAGRRCWHARRTMPRLRLAVVGGGAGGVELALVGATSPRRLLGERARGDAGHPRRAAAVAQSSGAPPCSSGFSPSAASPCSTDSPVVRVEPGALVCADGRRSRSTRRLWVTEARRRPVARRDRAALDRGRLCRDRRDPALAGRPAVFAAGDVATMLAHPREKAGVYAVAPGPAARRQSAPRARRQAPAPRRAATPRRWP